MHCLELMKLRFTFYLSWIFMPSHSLSFPSFSFNPFKLPAHILSPFWFNSSSFMLRIALWQPGMFHGTHSRPLFAVTPLHTDNLICICLNGFSFIVAEVNHQFLTKLSHIAVLQCETLYRLVDRNRDFVRICYVHLLENCVIFWSLST